MSDKKIKLRNGEYLYKGYLIHNIGFKSYRFSNRWEVEDLDGNHIGYVFKIGRSHKRHKRNRSNV